MTSTSRSIFLYVALAAALAGGLVRAQQEPPRFRSSVEVTSVDVTVVDDNGSPVRNLQPVDFTVRIDGSPRRVISAEWVPLSTPPGAAPPPPPEGYSSNQGSTGGRLIIMVVDQPSIRPGDALSVLRSIEGFIDRLEPSDRIAAVSLGRGGAATPFTADRAQVKRALSGMVGQQQGSTMFLRNIALSEGIEIAAEISRGGGMVLAGVISRECAGLGGFDLDACREDISNQAVMLDQEVRSSTAETLQSLRALLGGLKTIDAPKTIVLVSGGLVLQDQQGDVLELGSRAADARTSLYVLKLDEVMADASLSRPTPVSDRNLRTEGLQLLASASRGALFNVIGNGSGVFARIQSEMSGYYLLGVESDPKDKDGKAHSLNITVGRRGTTVRSRRQLLATAGATQASPTSREAMMSALTSPLVVSALPLRVATFSVREPESQQVQLLIHADVGTDYSSAKGVTLGYIITNRNGRIVDSQAADAKLAPIMTGVPSPLQFVTSASLDPGDYVLKLSVVEGDRVGTIEHPIHAGLVPAGPMALSELMVGGPISNGDLLRPTVGYMVTFGTVHGYVEAYGAGSDNLAVKYEVATDPDSAALLDVDATATPGGKQRTIFSEMLSVGRLPPGKYVLRAVVSSDGQPLKTMTRPFEVAAPAVLMTTAESGGTIRVPPAELYLPVTSEMFVRGFRREDASRADTLRVFRQSVTPESRASFDKGAQFLASGDYVNAEQSFKNALRVDDQSSIALAYLGATYAASGHDTEAAGAWQTSLIDGSEFPQIYEWLGDALLRLHELPQAKTILEEAVGKWPSDVRFTKPLALVYATFGQGREAMRTLERHLSAHPEDREALELGVEWMYHLHAAGAVAHTPADDVKLAREWANAYMKAKGPQAPLVKEWMQVLEGAKR